MPRNFYWPTAFHTGCLRKRSARTTQSIRCGQPAKLNALCGPKSCSVIRSGAAGTTLLELLLVVAIVGVLLAISAPVYQSSLKSIHLSSATTSVTGAIQSTRFRSVVSGCEYTLALTQGITTYQLAWQALSGTPPACPVGSAFTNVGTAIPWSTSGDVSLTSSITLQFCPNGTVGLYSTTAIPPCSAAISSFTLSNGSSTTKTITVSGVGNVTVTSP